jgi:hypothetical protein
LVFLQDIVTHLHDLARLLVEKEMQSSGWYFVAKLCFQSYELVSLAVRHVLTLLAGFVCSKPSSSDLELIVKLLAEPKGSPVCVSLN